MAQVRPALQKGGARVDPHAAGLLRFIAPAVVFTAGFAAAGSDIAHAEIADNAQIRGSPRLVYIAVVRARIFDELTGMAQLTSLLAPLLLLTLVLTAHA